MKKIYAHVFILMSLSVSAHGAALSGEAATGKKLHDANCTACHTDSVYLRKDRQVTNLDMLKNQMKACGHAMNITLGKTQTEDLVKYLNDTYYKFK